MISRKTSKNKKALILGHLVMLCGMLVMILTLPNIVLADNPFGSNLVNYAPPNLDEVQAYRWVNALPSSRPYLAELWGIDRTTAENYGARYVSPSCGYSTFTITAPVITITTSKPFIPSIITPSIITVFTIPFNGESIPKQLDFNYSSGSQWNSGIGTDDAVIFTPIKIDYPKYDISGDEKIIPYSYPMQLDITQGIRWNQALPSARMYLARLWDIPMEQALEYGARF